MKTFFSFFLLIQVALLANFDPYRLFVTEVDEESHSFVLSSKVRCDLVDQSEKIPQVGEEIFILPTYWPDASSSKESLFFIDLSGKEVMARISPASKNGLLFCHGKSEFSIHLSDGSEWEVADELKGFEDITEAINKTDRILLSRLPNHQYLLINLDNLWEFGDNSKYVSFSSLILQSPN